MNFDKYVVSHDDDNYPCYSEIKRRLKGDIDSQRLTTAERDAAMQNISAAVRAEYNSRIKHYKDLEIAAAERFWADARAELGYCDFLGEKGVAAVEEYAYAMGHSSGLSEVHSYLDNIVDVARAIVSDCKKT